MVIEVTVADKDCVGGDLAAVGAPPRASEFDVPERAVADAAEVAIERDIESLRPAAVRAVRACRCGRTVAWILDKLLPLATAE
jgi:hypothetical protein